MTDLTITAANVVAGTGAKRRDRKAGAAVTAGQLVINDSADLKAKLADSDSGTAALRAIDGIALHGAANGQPLAVHYEGPIVIGATLVPGTIYVASDTPGGIMPAADLETGDYVTIIGVAISATVLDVMIHNSGAQL